MHEIASLLQSYGLIVVFASVLLDVAGVPLPSFPVLMVAGALAASNRSLMVLTAISTAAAVCADLMWYFAGARLGRRVLGLVCRFTLSPDSCIGRTESTFSRYGVWTLPVAKFVPGLGYVAVALSGQTRMGLARFLGFDGLGAVLYVALPLALGSLFHNAVDALIATITQLGIYGLALVALILAIYVGGRWLERRAFARQLRMSRISVTELASRIDNGDRPVIFDVRNATARLQDGVIPGAVPAHFSDLSGLTERYAPNTDIVIYCACPNEASAAVAALHLKRAGFTNIKPLLGGIEAWRDAGYPIDKIPVQERRTVGNRVVRQAILSKA